MEIVFNENELQHYMKYAVDVSNEKPVLLDRFLNDAIEVDIDAVCDGDNVLIGGIMQHIEQAGIHSGDSACSLPPFSLNEQLQEQMREQIRKLAKALKVVGLMNAQLAVKDNEIYVLEVNPRASRTVPFVSKCIGFSLAKVAARCMVGTSLQHQNHTKEVIPLHFSVKEAIFPFNKFPGVDPILGPEMKSTGEVMGVGVDFAEAFAKSQLAINNVIPSSGKAFLSVRDADKEKIIVVGKYLHSLGFDLVATGGTATVLAKSGIDVKRINKVREGRPHIVDLIKNGEITLIVNTTEGKQAIADSYAIRNAALQQKVYYTTTVEGASAVCSALQSRSENITVTPVQAFKTRELI